MANNFEMDFSDHSGDVLKALDQKVDLALGAIGEIIEGHAKEDCPVDTGLLRNSITYAVAGKTPHIVSYHAEKTSTGQSAYSGTTGSVRLGHYGGSIGSKDEKAVYVGSNVEYAAIVELSDRPHKVGKAHFLRDGALNHRTEISEVAKAILKS